MTRKWRALLPLWLAGAATPFFEFNDLFALIVGLCLGGNFIWQLERELEES